MKSPSLEMFKNRLDVVLGSVLWVALPGQGAAADFQRSLLTSHHAVVSAECH